MATYNGTSARNVWNGTASADTARGNGGDDSLYGKSGNDILYGDAGNDGLYGDDGNDTLWGGDGVDALTGGVGADTLRGGNGDDYILGGIGDDGLYGDAGNDRLRGEDGIDALFGGAEIDDLQGGNGDDHLDGGTENDTLNGGAGNDRLRGSDGNDTLNGSTGNDDLRGGNGNDTLIYENAGLVKPGTGLFFGDAGTDTLTIKAGSATIAPPGSPVVSATAYISVDYDGSGGVFGFDDRGNGESGSSIFTQIGTFAGIETFTVSPDTRLDFSGGVLNAKVTGGNQHDRFFSGDGSETFNGGGGADEFYFGMPGGPADVDRIVGFNPAEDVIVTGLWENSQGDPIRNMSMREANGETIVTTTKFSGDLVHTMIIDEVGLPPDIFKDAFAWG